MNSIWTIIGGLGLLAFFVSSIIDWMRARELEKTQRRLPNHLRMERFHDL